MKYLARGLVFGGILLFILILRQAVALSNLTTAASRSVTFGFLTLLEINKEIIDGGYAATFTARTGLAIYWFGIAMIAFFLSVFQNNKDSLDQTKSSG